MNADAIVMQHATIKRGIGLILFVASVSHFTHAAVFPVAWSMAMPLLVRYVVS